MICNDDFDTSSGFRFGKISVSCSVHFYSLYLIHLKQKKKLKTCNFFALWLATMLECFKKVLLKLVDQKPLGSDRAIQKIHLYFINMVLSKQK